MGKLFKLSIKFDSLNRTKLPCICFECRYIKVCGGDFKRMRNQMLFEKNGEFCGYKNFLDFVTNDMVKISIQLILQYNK